jgi:hypothetical protein
MADMLIGEAQHRLGEDKADTVLQTLAQPMAPVGIVVRVPGMATNPESPVVPQLDGGCRNIVSPEIEGPATGKVEPGMMPVAG